MCVYVLCACVSVCLCVYVCVCVAVEEQRDPSLHPGGDILHRQGLLQETTGQHKVSSVSVNGVCVCVCVSVCVVCVCVCVCVSVCVS